MGAGGFRGHSPSRRTRACASASPAGNRGSTIRMPSRSGWRDAVSRAIAGVRTEADSAGDDEVLERDESALFVVRFFRDRCTVSADASGALLHRRGYRQATAKAPLRETLAAALLAASEWDGVAPLVDPMCGSGTIPIEAALMARRLPPGARRAFAVERWPGISAELVRAVETELGASGARRRTGRDRRKRSRCGRDRERTRERERATVSRPTSSSPCTPSRRCACPTASAGGS